MRKCISASIDALMQSVNRCQRRVPRDPLNRNRGLRNRLPFTLSSKRQKHLGAVIFLLLSRRALDSSSVGGERRACAQPRVRRAQNLIVGREGASEERLNMDKVSSSGPRQLTLQLSEEENL